MMLLLNDIMNDEEKIFEVSELFVVEMERWYVDTSYRNVAKYSDVDKVNEIHHLEYIITEAKKILDKPRRADDD